MAEYRSNLLKGSYQVWSESESELKSERDNYQKTIRLQLMCCAPDPFFVLIYER